MMKNRLMISVPVLALMVALTVTVYGETISISTIEDLQSIGTGEYPMNGDYVLAADINASATRNWNGKHGFLPLGNDVNRFTGTLDGQGFTISELFIEREEEYVGLFRFIDASGSIKRIHFKNCHVAGYKRTGMVAGENKGDIEGITLDAECSISGKLYVGSVTGYLETGGMVTGCTFSGTVEGVGAGTDYGRVGGFAGLVKGNSSIENCRNEGSVTGVNDYTGGITGMTAGTISRCLVTHSVSGQNYTGGIAGINDDFGEIENCSVGAHVTGNNYTGGVVGSNQGTVEYTGTLDTASVEGGAHVGGFAGENQRVIQYSYSSGDVSASDDYVGGFSGYCYHSRYYSQDKIKQCAATGNVNAETSYYVGGFVGYLQDYDPYPYNFTDISECYARGSVIGRNYVGGFIGYCSYDDTIISECYSTGEVAGTYSSIGGFAGYAYSSLSFRRSYWDIDTSNLGYSDGGTGRSTDEMQHKDYYDSWDWTSVWANEEGAGYPYLRAIPPECMPDTTPPVLTLLGESSIEHACGERYEDLGATAEDGCDGDLTKAVQMDGTVNINVPGTYTLTYSVSDLSGHPAKPLTRIVTVTDKTPPAVTLTGNTEITLMAGTEFEDPGATALDSCGDTDLSSGIERSGSVNTGQAGVYTITYSVSDAAENRGEARRTVTVLSGGSPLITVQGANPLIVECGTAFKAPDASAQDEEDGDLTAQIHRAGEVNMHIMGTCDLIYTVTDSNGNEGAVTLHVTVVDETSPVITLNGNTEIALQVGDEFADPGATATDSCGNVDLTSAIMKSGSVNTNMEGDYTLTYRVMDHVGNTKEATRRVRVSRDDLPVITLIGPENLDLECGAVFEDPGARAMDTSEGDISASIVVGGDAVDTHVPGGYAVIYNVADSEGHAAVPVMRIVTVKDTQKPDITLLGANPMKIEYGAVFTEPGVIATDACDGDMSDAVTISGDTVITTAPRTYTIRYSVTDANHNERTTVRQVVVLSRDAVAVPNLFNMTLEQAGAALSKAKLVLGAVKEAYHNSVAKGHIVSQNPKAGSNALSGESVTVEVSKGPQGMVEGENVAEGETPGEGETDEGEGELVIEGETDEGEGEIAAEGEKVEGEGENDDGDSPAGCNCGKSGTVYDAWKRMWSDLVLLSLAMAMLLGVSSMKH